MAEPLQALCVSDDSTTGAGVAAMLASLPDFSVATRMAGCKEELQDARPPDLAIVVLDDDPAPALAVIDALRRGARGTYVVAVSLDDDPDTIVKAMRAGADEHLFLPLSQQDVLKVCIKVAELRRGGTTPKTSRGGELWVAYSPKGGVGVTTLVVNLAVALHGVGRDVALIDLDVFAGDVALFLDLRPAYTLRDLAINFKRLDPVFLRGTMVRHSSGLQILAASSAGRGEPPVELSAEQTMSVLQLVTGMHEVTLVDTPGIPSEATRVALTTADRILLVTDLSVPALRGCARTIDWLRGEGVDPANVVDVIVNKYSNRSTEISPTEASRTLDLPLRALIPRDDAAAWASSNSGRPLAGVPEGAALQRAIAGLVSRSPTPLEASGRRRVSLLRLFSGAARRSGVIATEQPRVRSATQDAWVASYRHHSYDAAAVQRARQSGRWGSIGQARLCSVVGAPPRAIGSAGWAPAALRVERPGALAACACPNGSTTTRRTLASRPSR